MKSLPKSLSWLAFAAALAAGALAALPRAQKTDFDVQAFAQLPVLEGGRVKPIDSVARNSLLLIHGKQSVVNDGGEIGPDEWLLNVLFRPSVADALPLFNVDDPDVLGLIGRQQTSNRYLSFHDLSPSLAELQRQGQGAHEIEASQRSRFEKAVANLWERVFLYYRLETATFPFDSTLRGPQAEELDKLAVFRPLPPLSGEAQEAWKTFGTAKLAADPRLKEFADLRAAWAAQDASAFNRAVATIGGSAPSGAQRRVAAEMAFNRAQPFYVGMGIYLVALLMVFFSWIGRPQLFRSLGFGLLGGGAIVHTVGLVTRMLLQGRPPVTNLYSSAVFVGWCVVLLGLVIERLYRRGIATGVAAAVGFTTLLIAHHLAADGDTLEMMRAVLDSNFWLATHVVTVTMGYSGTFLAGTLAVAYALRRQFVTHPQPETSRALGAMTYGILCFSLLFSFVGTMLGGIWADQSWGRFWGWDPKENGALLIVLWNAIILHSRMGGYVRERGLMGLAIFGNVITSLSWFGVNMLGIGLHSYGFMDKAFWALAAFDAVQLLLIGLCFLPAGFVVSAFQSRETETPGPAAPVPPVDRPLHPAHDPSR